MKNPGITLMGLGPGNPDLLTKQAWNILETAKEIYLRTSIHPVVREFPADLEIHSFDSIYEEEQEYERVYNRIIERILKLGKRSDGVIYAVPGHPFVAETTTVEIARRAGEMGMNVTVVEGLSFIEPVMTALGLDLFPQTALIDALELAITHVPPFPPSSPALITQIHSNQVASDVKLTLMSIYPDDHPVHLVHAAGTKDACKESLVLYEIDRSSNIDWLTALYVPALSSDSSFEAFQELIARLRAPNGCPWDREQTHKTLRPNLLEETYEVLSALDKGDSHEMCEELGDLLLQIILHAQIASEYGGFNSSKMLQKIHRKIVNRHPHVFGDVDITGSEDVIQNWEHLKAVERSENGKGEAGILDSVVSALPALIRADIYQKRVARVGFDWPEEKGVIEKVREEINEVCQAESNEERQAEIGDLFFSVVNLARWYGIDSESALRQANDRFKVRFSKIEEAARSRGCGLSELSLGEMEEIWQQAKK